MPETTVLMTVYNGMPYLPLAIESILSQTYGDFEFLIVNDCSTDDSRKIILGYDDPRIRLIDNDENLGQTRSLNRGLEHTRTTLVARMDADDISHKNRMEKQVEYLKTHPDVVAVGTNLRTIDPDGRYIGSFSFPEQDLTLRWMQMFTCPVSCGAVMFKTGIIRDEFGGFNPSIRYAQDWELWSRVLPNYRLANVQDFLLDVREHPGASSTASNRVMLEEKYRINRMNPKRILGIHNDSEQWLQKVDTLLSKKVDNPEHRLEVINLYFKRFCKRYPQALDDTMILDILANQYIKYLYHTQLRFLPGAISAFASTWIESPANFCRFPKQCFLSLGEIPSHLKYWTGRNIFGYNR